MNIHRLRQIAFSALVALSPALVSPSRGQTTEETFRQLASELPFVSYGDFLSDSKPGYAGQDQVFKAWAALQAVMKTKPPFADLAKLVKHDDPKVRTLALLGLFDREEQAAFPLIHSLAEDAAATFPAQFEPGGRAIDEPLRLYTKPATVGSVALRMLETIGFRADWLGSKGREQTFAEWSARRLGNPDWVGWYDFLYRRASQAKSAQRIAALREKMAGLPQAVRAWMWMGLADDGMMIPQTDTALATEAEIIEAAKKLGPAALLAFLRDGERAGLRARVDDPARGRRFILAHARQLFRERDAAALLKMKHFIAAADARPAMSAQWLRQALQAWSASWQNGDRASAVAALLDHRGDAEADFIVEWFYHQPYDRSESSGQSMFMSVVQGRRPKEWRKTVRAIFAHPGFEQLAPGDVSDAARMVNRLSAEEVIGQDLFRDRNEGAVRNKLREYFGIATVVKTRLEVPPSLAEKPLWSAPIKGHAHSLALSPEGKMLAVGHARDGVFLLDGATGVRVADLPAKGEYLRVQFRKSDGHLLTFNMMKSLAEWDVAGRKLLREQSLKTSPLNDIVFSDSCDMIAGGSANEPSVSVMDLKTGTLRWTQPMRIRGFALIALSPDDRRLAVCDGFSKTIMLWDTASPNPIARLEGHAGVPGRARFSPDGAWLISTGDDEKILLWDGRTGALRHEYTGSVARFNAVAFTADSQRFIACPAHGKFGVFDCATGQATHGFTVPGNWVSEMSVSADGTRLFMLVVRSDGLGTHESRVDCWSLAETK